jgi:hypothetical protein
MMIQPLLQRVSRVLGCAAIAFAATTPVHSATVTGIQIIGADNCTSWTWGVSSGTPTLTCNTTTLPPGSPFSCTLTGAPTAGVAAGTQVVLSANCQGGTAPYTYAWSRSPDNAGLTNKTSSTLTVTPQVATSYGVTATDAVGAPWVSPVATITIATGSGGGGDPGSGAGTNAAITAACTAKGFSNTQIYDFDWTNFSVPSITARALGQNDAVVIRMTTGSGGYGRISGAEFQAPPAQRYSTISTAPCDFGQVTQPPTTTIAASTGLGTDMLFSAGPNSSGVAAAPSNTLIYFNLRTTDPCGSLCNMIFYMTRYNN